MAQVQPSWSGPPTADEIRRLDQDRMAQDPLLAEEPSEDDLVMARTLLEQRSAEEVAAALVRVYRSRLPAPEEITDPGQSQPVRKPTLHQEAGARGGDGGHSGGVPASSGGGSWFRMNIGRRNNADPRWLLPMLCRRGGITKGDIGAIRIFDRETKFEVRDGAAHRFAETIRSGQNLDPRIEPAADAPPQRPRPRTDDAAAHHRHEEQAARARRPRRNAGT